MKINNKTTHLLSLCWLAVSVAIFLLAWCHWYFALPLIAAIGYTIKRFHATIDAEGSLEISGKKIVLAMIIIIAMMALCGIGGYVVQPNDHYYRNGVFGDIVNYDWPIYNAKENLYMCYYFTFWLIPALVAKFFNSIDLGFFAQLIWISIGFFLLFLEVCIYIGKVKLGTLFVFYFFSGWKVIECLLYFPLFGGDTIRNTILTLSTNSSPGVFHAGPMVQLLYDPYNQTIPLFLSMMLILNNRRSDFIAFIYSLVLYYAPFPFIGLSPIVLYLFIKNTNWSSIKCWAKSWFTLSNILGLILILIIGLFFSGNINVSTNQGLRPTQNIMADIYSFVLYLVFEIGIFLVFGYRECKDRTIIWIAISSVCIFGWFQMGGHNDFCFRTNMPLIFILCLLVIKRFYNEKTSLMIKRLILCSLLVGGITSQIHPMLRYISTACILTGRDQAELNQYQSFYDVTNMYVMQQKTIRNDEFGSVFGKGKEWDWCVKGDKASPDSFFFKYIARK